LIFKVRKEMQRGSYWRDSTQQDLLFSFRMITDAANTSKTANEENVKKSEILKPIFGGCKTNQIPWYLQPPTQQNMNFSPVDITWIMIFQNFENSKNVKNDPPKNDKNHQTGKTFRLELRNGIGTVRSGVKNNAGLRGRIFEIRSKTFSKIQKTVPMTVLTFWPYVFVFWPITQLETFAALGTLLLRVLRTLLDADRTNICAQILRI